jgi:predicted HTH transcriptional regulator
MIAAGESPIVEFKSSLRWDVKKGIENKELQKACTKSLAAFMNGYGGHLIIGVEDNGYVFGLEKDMGLLASLGQGGADGFSQAFANVIRQHLTAAVAALFTTSFVVLDGRTVCVAAVRPSPKPIYLSDGKAKEFFVRLETTTQALPLEESVNYIQVRWRPQAST